MKMGHHITLDLHKCRRNLVIPECDGIAEEPIGKEITRIGFQIIGTIIKRFENGSYTLIYGLSESHVSVHTWPEEGYVAADIFVCNYSRDNTQIAESLILYLVEHFESTLEDTIINRILRD